MHNDLGSMGISRMPAPLVYRCRCGRVISLNKLACKACADAEEQRLMASIEPYAGLSDADLKAEIKRIVDLSDSLDSAGM